jgi:hypothetical protein
MPCNNDTILRMGFSDSLRPTAPTELMQREESNSDNDNDII